MQKENNKPVYYYPPASHDRVLKKMLVSLTVFFASLFALLTCIIIFADRLVVYLPFSAEKQFVRPYETMASELFKQEHSESQTLIENYLKNLTRQLTVTAQLPQDYQIEVHYLESDAINAFATLGGHIFVCHGILEALPNENSLAMVLAHEIAHIKRRDPAVGMTRGFALQLIYSFISGDYNHSALASYGGEFGLLYFSREQEKLADLDALAILNGQYGHVGGFDDVFKIIDAQQESASEVAEKTNWFSSHPDLKQRIEYLNQIVELNQWQQQPTVPMNQEIKQALEMIATKNSAEGVVLE